MRHTVFLSYSHFDEDKVNELEQVLQQLDVDCRRDVKDIHPTDHIDNAIDKMVKSSGTVIVALSNNSIAAPWVTKEREKALTLISAGAPLKIVYVVVEKNIYIPDFVKSHLYIDFSSARNRPTEIIKLAKSFIHTPAARQIGIYDVYANVGDLDNRRERHDGTPGCSVNDFVSGASEKVVAVGLWFGALFDMDRGAALANCLISNDKLVVEIYVPNIDQAPLAQLIGTHQNPDGVVGLITQFVDLFRKWGKERKLTEAQASRVTLRLLPFIPTFSLLCTDPHLANGRMIVDLYAPGIEPSKQLKFELRGPTTESYQTFLRSLAHISNNAVDGPKTSHISSKV